MWVRRPRRPGEPGVSPEGGPKPSHSPRAPSQSPSPAPSCSERRRAAAGGGRTHAVPSARPQAAAALCSHTQPPAGGAGPLLEAPAGPGAGRAVRDRGRAPAALTWTPGPWRRRRCGPCARRRRPFGAPAPGTTKRGSSAAGSGPHHFLPAAVRRRPPAAGGRSAVWGQDTRSRGRMKKGRKKSEVAAAARCLGRTAWRNRRALRSAARLPAAAPLPAPEPSVTTLHVTPVWHRGCEAPRSHYGLRNQNKNYSRAGLSPATTTPRCSSQRQRSWGDLTRNDLLGWRTTSDHEGRGGVTNLLLIENNQFSNIH